MENLGLDTLILIADHCASFSNSFQRTAVFPYTAWLAKCCDLLEQQSNIEQDHILVWLVRYHHISDELTTLQKSYKKPGSQSEPHRLLIHRGLESQLREWQSRIPTNIAMMRTSTTYHPRPAKVI